MIFFGTSDFHFLTTTLIKNHLSSGDIFGCGECIVSVRQSKEGLGPTALVSSLISIRIIIFPFVHRHCIVVEIVHFRLICRPSSMFDDDVWYAADNGALVNSNNGMYLPGRNYPYLKKLEVDRCYEQLAALFGRPNLKK